MSVVDDIVRTVRGTQRMQRLGIRPFTICIAPEKRDELASEMRQMQRFGEPTDRHGVPFERYATIRVCGALIGEIR